MPATVEDWWPAFENSVMMPPRTVRCLLLPIALGLSASGVGCQQQMTALSGWVTDGDESTIVRLEGPEVELASPPVAGATVAVHKRERGKDRMVTDVQTDRTGHFSLAILRDPGSLARWQLTVEKPGLKPASTGWRRLPAKRALYWRVSLAPEAPPRANEAKKRGVDTSAEANVHSPRSP